MKKNMLFVFVVMMVLFAVSGLAGAPSVSNVNLSFVEVLGQTPPDQDLNTSGTTSDPDGDPVKLIYDWKKDGVSVLPLNMPFEGVTCAGCSSNASDYGGTAQNGAAMNGIVWSKTAGTDGKGAYILDGTNDFINVSHHDELNLTSDFSMEAWIKPNVLSGYKAIISKNINPRPASLWLNGNKVEVWWGTGSGSMKLQSNGGLDATRWAHVVATYKGSTLKLYINGVLNTTASSVAVPPTNANPITLGQRGDNSLYFNGTMDEVRLWKVALPADQVADQYNKVTNLLSEGLTLSGDEWGAVVTPNDGFNDGTPQYPVVLPVPYMLSACKTSGWIANEAYELSTYLAAVSGSCMVIDASGVTLNCAGPKHYIDGDDSGPGPDYGIRANANYVTVKNCNVTDFDTGLYVTGNYGTFTNDILSSNVDGLKISGSTGSAADKIDVAVAAYNNTGDGISFVSSSYISGVNLDIESNLDDGISVDSSTDVNLSGGSYWNSDDGIYLTNSNTVDLHNLIVFANVGNGISGSNSDNVHVYNTTAPSYTSVMNHNTAGKAGILVGTGCDNWVVDKGIWLQSNSIALKYTSIGTGNTFQGLWFAPSNTLGIDVDGQNALFYENKIDGSGSANWVDCSNSNNAFDNGARGNVWGDYYKIEQYCNDGDHDNYCDDPYVTDGSAACTDNWPIQTEESATGCDALLNSCKSSGWKGGTSGNRGIFCLGSDISNAAPASTCMGIDDDYVTLDCNRFNTAYTKIDGDDLGTDSGISIAGAVSGATVQDCNVTDFNSAVAYSSTGSSNTVTNVGLKSNVNGVEVTGSAANLAFSSNQVKSNTGSGVKYSTTGTGNTFSSNKVVDNAKGAEVTSTGQNAVLHSNYFTANTVQAECANSNNAFDNNAVGNHWSDYDELSEGCYDENMNNFCDTARTIASASCTDDFPYQDVEHPNCDTLLSACKSSSWVNNAKYCLGQTITTTADCMVMGSTVSGVVLNCSGFGAAETIQGDNVGVGDDGINIDRSDNVKIDHCRIQNFTKALQVTGGGADRTTNLAFLRNTVYVEDQQYGGLLSYTNNALFFRNTFLSAYQATGLTLDNDNDNAVVERNDFYSSEQGTSGLEVGTTTNDNLIVNGSNTFDGRGGSSNDGLRLGDVDGAQVYHNIFRNFVGPYASGVAGVFLNGDADNNQFWNNDFLNNTRGAIRWSPFSNNNVFDVSGQGNYWENYDSTGEGCNDVSPADGFCDAAYDTGLLYGDPNPVVDNYPWTTAQN